MANLPQNYKFIFIIYFVINAILVISILIIEWLDYSLPKTKGWIESWICFWGITMLLFLWSKSFIVTSKKNGRKSINGRITRLFVYSLVIIEFLTLFLSLLGHKRLLIPLTIIMLIWVIIFTCSFLTKSKFIFK